MDWWLIRINGLPYSKFFHSYDAAHRWIGPALADAAEQGGVDEGHNHVEIVPVIMVERKEETVH